MPQRHGVLRPLRLGALPLVLRKVVLIDEHAALDEGAHLFGGLQHIVFVQQQLLVFVVNVPGQGLPRLDLVGAQSQKFHGLTRAVGPPPVSGHAKCPKPRIQGPVWCSFQAASRKGNSARSECG